MERKKRIEQQIGTEYLGPILSSYITWVLEQAKQKGLKILFFLARDGYLMYEAAKRIQAAKPEFADIGCRYLYCSRLSLRLPICHLMPLGDVAELLFTDKTRWDLEKFLDGTGFLSNEKNMLAGVFDTALQGACAKVLSDAIENSEAFCKLFKEKAAKAYETTVGYLEQEGLFAEPVLGVVDSGWFGTMEDSLYELLRSRKPDIVVYGFYFGLYRPMRNSLCETKCFNAFYFYNDIWSCCRKATFNCNVFELLCSGNHGMTLRYERRRGRFEPVLMDFQPQPTREVIQESALQSLVDLNRKALFEKCRKLMHAPSPEIAWVIGELDFSESVFDAVPEALAPELNQKEAGRLLLPCRIGNAIRKNGRRRAPYWPEGCIMRSNLKHRNFLLFNILVWNLARNFMISITGGTFS